MPILLPVSVLVSGRQSIAVFVWVVHNGLFLNNILGFLVCDVASAIRSEMGMEDMMPQHSGILPA